VARASALRESGTESILFFRLSSSLERVGIPFRSQVAVPGVGRVDFVIGERLIVEVDGARYHTDRERFESDRRRDAYASASGHRALRFSFRQVTERWPEVESAIWAAIARGDHV
jgi:very-short-patch-repair endonuclease